MTVKYDDMTKKEKISLINKEHIKGGISIHELAQKYGTYPNRIRREAKVLGVKLRNKSEAQKNALETGKAPHPTKGTERPADTKIKISDSMAASWDDKSPEERERLAEVAREQWKNMSVDDRKVLKDKAIKAVRKAAKEGSKLEKYILQGLISAGYKVDFHKEHLLLNERLQLDLFLPIIGVAIEVDGPSHFLPIWGNKTLQRNKKSDNNKNGLLLSRGIYVIRIKQDSFLSDKYKRDTLARLLEVLQSIKDKTFSLTKRYIEL